MTIEIKVLGPLEATTRGMSVVPSAPKQRQVFALLALNVSRVVTVPTLIEEIWEDRPPTLPLGSLHTHILHLRRKMDRVLARHGHRSSKEVLTTGPGGYSLDVPRDNVDVAQYERLVSVGRQAISRADFATAARKLAEALDVWSGETLVDVPVGPVLDLERTRLEESRLCTLDLRIDADLRLGKHQLILDELAALCTRHPWFENFHAQYMLALHRSGRQWRALEVYRKLHATVGEHLGVDPSRHLRELHRAILAEDPLVDDPSFVISGLTGEPA